MEHLIIHMSEFQPGKGEKNLTILDLLFGHVGGEAQKNILLVILWAPSH